jgi:hypothetical protein
MTAGDIKIRSGTTQDRMSGIVCNGSDDYMACNALATYEAGANNVSGTISGWMNVPNITGTFCLFSIGVNAAISYIQVSIKAGKLNCVGASAGAGGTRFDVISTNTVITPHKWHHIAVVHSGGATVGRPFLYVDGLPVAMTDTTATDLTFWMNDLATWDRAAIGILAMNATLTLDMLGAISYVKYATGTTDAAAWTNAQVNQEYDYRAGYGDGSGVTSGVLCTWPLEDLLDYTTGGGTYSLTLTSDVQYDTEYSQMTSKLRLLAPVVADDFNILSNGMNGSFTFVLVKAA